MVSASAFGLAPLIASPLGGEVYDHFGPKAVFLCASLFAGGATLVLLITIKKGIFTDPKPAPIIVHKSLGASMEK